MKCRISLSFATYRLLGDASGTLSPVYPFILLKSLPETVASFSTWSAGIDDLNSKKGTWRSSHLSTLSLDSPPVVSLLLHSLLGFTWPLLGLHPSLLLEGPWCVLCREELCFLILPLISLLVPDLHAQAQWSCYLPRPLTKRRFGMGGGGEQVAWATANIECAHRNSRPFVFLHLAIVLNQRLSVTQLSHLTMEIPY